MTHVDSSMAFRRSMYLALMLSNVCLSYAEWDYLPEVSVFAGAVILAMFAAYRLDTLNRHLTIAQANVVGVVIFLLALGWFGYHYRQPMSLMHTLAWPAGGLPFIAPLLMLLIPAKLFRPKHNGDWWGLYGISLAEIGLAMSLAEDAFIILLVMLYAVVSVWSLTLFYLHRAGHADRVNQRGQMVFSLKAVAVAGLVALPVFFLTPRSHGVQWELFHAKVETGLNPNGEPDLSRTGQLKPSKETAFEVTAYSRSGVPKTDLPLDLRFRGISYTEYRTPRWSRSDAFAPPLINGSDMVQTGATERMELPDLGPAAYLLDYQLVLPVVVYADPVLYTPRGPSPIAVPLRTRVAYARQVGDTSFAIMANDYRFSRGYVQVYKTDGEATWFPLASDNKPVLFAPFLGAPPRGVADYAQRLLSRLVTDGKLPRGRLDPAATAEAFRDHFSTGFTYTLDLRRQDKSLDPIEDFLLNTRSGHCERFASALVLMLRGVGIPAQFVTGFRGSESIGSGQYRVRQENAHAWAEVLLNKPGTNEWSWQCFDPTPGTAASEIDETGGFVATSTKQTQKLFSDYVINLNPDTQARLHAGVSEFFEDNWPWLAASVFGIVFAIMALRRFLRRKRALGSSEVQWFAILMEKLHRGGLPVVSGETPREFADRAAVKLNDDLPRKAAELLYATRYAGKPIELQQLETIKTAIASL